MARTVAGRREEQRPITGTGAPPYRDRSAACAFCVDRTPVGVRHDLCPGEIHTNPGRKDDKVWTCQCWKEGHPR